MHELLKILERLDADDNRDADWPRDKVRATSDSTFEIAAHGYVENVETEYQCGVHWVDAMLIPVVESRLERPGKPVGALTLSTERTQRNPDGTSYFVNTWVARVKIGRVQGMARADSPGYAALEAYLRARGVSVPIVGRPWKTLKVD